MRGSIRRTRATSSSMETWPPIPKNVSAMRSRCREFLSPFCAMYAQRVDAGDSSPRAPPFLALSSRPSLILITIIGITRSRCRASPRVREAPRLTLARDAARRPPVLPPTLRGVRTFPSDVAPCEGLEREARLAPHLGRAVRQEVDEAIGV